MFNIENYINQSGSDYGLELEGIYFVYLLVLTLINVFFFLKTRGQLKLNPYPQESIKYFFFTMIGLVLWNFGELILSLSYFIFDNKKSFLVGTDNFFIPLGVIMSTTFFSMYIQTILKTKRYRSRQKLISNKLVNVLTILIFFVFVMILTRFLLLGFLEPSFRDQSLSFTLIMLVISVLGVVIILLYVIVQLYRERKGVSSKINQTRISFFLWYYISLFLGLIGILIFLVLSLRISGEFILYLIPYIIFTTPTIAILLLYYGLFLPVWVQKRFGIIPDI